MNRLLPTFLLAAAFLAPPAQAQTMEAGEWEFTSTLNSPMLPQPQTATVSQCISKEDAADPTRFATNQKTQGCVVKPGARTADSFQWMVTCPLEGMTGAGKLRFTKRTIDAEIRMTVEMDGKKVEMLSTVSGKLKGPCTEK